MTNNAYHENFTQKVINCSESSTWAEAVIEWDIVDCVEDENLESSCICGKENLRYLFTIRNSHNENVLYPIGSSCIKKFGVEELYAKASLQEQLFRLLHAIEGREYIQLSSEYFSRKLLKHLYELGGFNPPENLDSIRPISPIGEYEFLLKMFNKRDKDKINDKANRRINWIIAFFIKPFLRDMLNDKIMKKKR